MQDSARVREEFDRIAVLSADVPENDRYQDLLLRHVPRHCENALDIGCGRGALARALASRATHVLGIDLSPEMVRLARASCIDQPHVDFILGEFMSLELPADHFDCITAVAALHHMPWRPPSSGPSGCFGPAVSC